MYSENCGKWSPKKGFTVALCALAAGEKLPAYIIFKERGGKLGPRVSAALTFPDNVEVSASINGWMTREELHRWLRGVWKESSIRKLLVLDNYRPHLGADTASLAEAWTQTSPMFLEAAQALPNQWMCPLTLHLRRPFRSSGSNGEGPQQQGDQTGR